MAAGIQVCLNVYRYLYWSDWGLEARIERARLDGSDRVHYVYTNITMPWGLTIDYETHTLYWCDTANDMQVSNFLRPIHRHLICFENFNSLVL